MLRRLLVAFAMLLSGACSRTNVEPKAVPRVIFVGLDGADWQLLDRFIADGTMPNLASLAREGDRGVLLTEQPPLSPLVWTTMMTGVSPLDHRILDFTRFNPSTRQREPITSDERAVPAIWNMASSAGKRGDVFGLWATWPAEAVNGAVISDRLFSYQYDAAPPPRSVSPASEEGWARGVVRQVDAATGFDQLRVYVPSLDRNEYVALAANANPFASPITALRRILVETEVVHRLAMERIERDRPDLAIVYFQGTDAVGHLFAPFFPPKLAAVSSSDFERFHDVPRRYFARIDTIVGDYRRLAREEGAVLVLASDHGFQWIDGRSPVSSTAVATAGRWHRSEGIVLQWPRGHAANPANVRGVCATLLKLLGMPDDIASYRRRFQRAQGATAVDASEAIEKLKALGYIGSGEAAATAGPGTRTAGSFNNEGLILRGLGRDEEAIAAFEGALRVDARNASAMWNLSDLLRRLHRDDRRAEELLESALAIDPNEPRWLVARGRMQLERHDCRGALRDFTAAANLSPDDALIHASRGAAELCLGDESAARKSFARSLELDPNQPALRRMVP